MPKVTNLSSTVLFSASKTRASIQGLARTLRVFVTVNVREHHSLGGSDFICFDTAILYLGGKMDAPLFIDEYHATTHLDNVNSCAYYCGILNPAN
jgi:hypothetical protein